MMRTFAAVDQAAADQAAASQRNIELFERMYLGLGPDVMKLAGSRHDLELAQAKASAAGRWERLVQLEQQVERESQNLAARPKKRLAEANDRMLAAEVIKRLEEEYVAQTDAKKASLEELIASAKKERAVLASFVVKNGVRREER